MIHQCPHCEGKLPFNTEQQGKLKKALAALDHGKLLTLKCPMCNEAIKLDKTGTPPNQIISVKPPSPPNLDWLASGVYQGEEKVEDVPTALLLYPPTEERNRLVEAIESIGYQVIVEDKAVEALERMRFVNVACIIYRADMDGPLDNSEFHRSMRSLPMERRRYIFYILIGPDFHSLYDIEALANSSNLVINSADLNHVEVILRKSIPEYEDLFGPIMEELGAFGKR